MVLFILIEDSPSLIQTTFLFKFNKDDVEKCTNKEVPRKSGEKHEEKLEDEE